MRVTLRVYLTLSQKAVKTNTQSVMDVPLSYQLSVKAVSKQINRSFDADGKSTAWRRCELQMADCSTPVTPQRPEKRGRQEWSDGWMTREVSTSWRNEVDAVSQRLRLRRVEDYRPGRSTLRHADTGIPERTVFVLALIASVNRAAVV